MKKNYPFYYVSLLFVSLFVSLLIFAADLRVGSAQKVRPQTDLAAKSADPVIFTRKKDLRAGESFAISGTGFQQFENVSVSVRRGDETIAVWMIAADADGNAAAQWRLPSDGKFTVRFFGNETKREAETLVTAITAPMQMAGNPNCASLNSSTNPAFAHISSNFGFKIDGFPSGTFPLVNNGGNTLEGGAPSDPNSSVATATSSNGTVLNWNSTLAFDAVIVKGGAGGANIYTYLPASGADTNLQTPTGQQISHIEFCYDYDPARLTIIKDSQPNTPLSFGFTASGQAASNFSLVDNGVVGPDRRSFTNLTGFGASNTVTVSENSLGSFYNLTQIICHSSANGGLGTNNNSVNLTAKSVGIVLEESENVTCTFVNSVTTASSSTLGGAVTNDLGGGIARVSVSIQNATTLETRTAITNSFGRYQFENLESGGIYVLTVQSKRYTFSPNSRVVFLSENVSDVDFTADSQ